MFGIRTPNLWYPRKVSDGDVVCADKARHCLFRTDYSSPHADSIGFQYSGWNTRDTDIGSEDPAEIAAELSVSLHRVEWWTEQLWPTSDSLVVILGSKKLKGYVTACWTQVWGHSCRRGIRFGRSTVRGAYFTLFVKTSSGSE